MALELAQIFGGGGHSEAAGCKITNNIFRSNFKVHSLNKYGINIQMDL